MISRIAARIGKTALGTLAAIVILVGSGALPAAAEMYRANDVIDAAAPVIDEYWSGILSANGVDYESPKLVHYNTPANPGGMTSGCGLLGIDNAFYCPYDKTIYLDEAFLQQLIDEEGDFVAALILAHEWSHHVEYTIGLRMTLDGELDRHGEVLGIELELLADCMAGATTTYFAEQGMLEAGDIDEGLSAIIAKGGDPDGIDPTQPGAHGTAEQRVDVFHAGFKSGNPERCGQTVERMIV